MYVSGAAARIYCELYLQPNATLRQTCLTMRMRSGIVRSKFQLIYVHISMRLLQTLRKYLRKLYNTWQKTICPIYMSHTYLLYV